MDRKSVVSANFKKCFAKFMILMTYIMIENDLVADVHRTLHSHS